MHAFGLYKNWNEWARMYSNLYGGHFENGDHLEWAEIFLGPLHFWNLHGLKMIFWKFHACITICTIFSISGPTIS
jgi:hypothetical protein